MEKVLKGLECCSQEVCETDECPYKEADHAACTTALARDALKTIKALNTLLNFMGAMKGVVPRDDEPSEAEGRPGEDA